MEQRARACVGVEQLPPSWLRQVRQVMKSKVMRSSQGKSKEANGGRRSSKQASDIKEQESGQSVPSSARPSWSRGAPNIMGAPMENGWARAFFIHSETLHPSFNRPFHTAQVSGSNARGGRELGESLARGRDCPMPSSSPMACFPLTRVPRHAILFLIASSGLRSPLARTSGDGGRVPCASARHASRL